jgi:ATP-dependent DNA ligase
MHPKTEIRPTPDAVEKILRKGWVGQMKVHGHRAQIHISADAEVETIVYNRQGRKHAIELSEEIVRELSRILPLNEGWTVLDAEWLKPEKKIFLFDVLKLDGKSLRSLTYEERYKLLPRAFISPHVKTLPLLPTLGKCMEVLGSQEEYVEGLVFKAPNSKGFEDTSIIRCRRRK